MTPESMQQMRNVKALYGRECFAGTSHRPAGCHFQSRDGHDVDRRVEMCKQGCQAGIRQVFQEVISCVHKKAKGKYLIWYEMAKCAIDHQFDYCSSTDTMLLEHFESMILWADSPATLFQATNQEPTSESKLVTVAGLAGGVSGAVVIGFFIVRRSLDIGINQPPLLA